MQTLLVPYHHEEALPGLARAFASDDAVVVSKGPPGSVLPRLYELVAGRVGASDAPLAVVSGDCTTSLATVAGLQRRGVDPSVIWLDAHGDFHTPRTTTSGYLGGMALAMLTGRTGTALTKPIRLRPIDEARCALVDARDLDPPERDALDASAIRRIGVDALAHADLPEPPWYVHLDIDIIDPTDVPPLRFPAPGGPTAETVARALHALTTRGTIAALGVGCTFVPQAFDLPEAFERVRMLLAAAR